MPFSPHRRTAAPHGNVPDFDPRDLSRPFEAPATIPRVVIVVAHPDDEVFCSGLICEVKLGPAHVTVLSLTRGEGGPCEGCSRAELGKLRTAEMQKACDELGVDDLVFLGHLDPVGSGPTLFAPEVSTAALARQLRAYFAGVDLVLSHGSNGEYGHPAHRLVFEAVKEAIDAAAVPSPAWMTFFARQIGHALPDLVNWDDPAFLRVDNTPHQERRCRSLACHRSQLGLFGRFAGGDHEDFIRLTAREAYALQKWGELQIPEATDKSKG